MQKLLREKSVYRSNFAGMRIRITISRAIFAFGTLMVVGLVAVIFASNYALSQLKVGGPIYNRIVLGNDLVSDILPPPEYVIEAYLEATLALHDPSSLAVHRDRLVQLKKDYDDRRNFWTKSDLDPAIKIKLVEKSHRDVKRFWTLVEQSFLPALAMADTAAATKSYADITAAYTAHRAVIEDIVKQTNDDNAATEAEAASRVEFFTRVLWGISAFVFVIVGAEIAGVAKGIIHPIIKMTGVMQRLAGGELDSEIPSLGREDEVGAMADAVQVFKENAVRVRAIEKELRREHERLEELVALRTADLTKTNERLEATNKELEAFSYSISHDLRVPIRAIDGFSRILLEDYSGKIDTEGQRLLNVVRDSTVKLAALIDDILAFSGIGRSELIPARIDMDGAVRGVLNELSPAAAGRKLTFHLNPLAPARGDAAMIRRVWTNLIDNAIKFTALKPDAVIEIGSTSDREETIYYVKDNGAGFDMQYADKLFGAFERLHGSEFAGAGIGLAIVKRIVARHGGRVWAEGKVNEGATFYFALPIRDNPDA